MSEKRLILLGIDGMDYKLTESYLDSLPNINRLSKEGFVSSFKSVFPPDSKPDLPHQDPRSATLLRDVHKAKTRASSRITTS